MSEDETFKASHFENIQELINTCKVWIRDDDYDAYCRFFDMGAMEELLNELEQEKEKNKELLNSKIGVDLSYDDYVSKDKIKKLLQEIDIEYVKAENTFDSHFEKVNRDMQDYYIQKEATSIMQELSWIKGRIEELLEEE